MIVNNIVLEPDYVDRLWHNHELAVLAEQDRWKKARMAIMTKEQVVKAELVVIFEMYMKGQLVELES